MKNIVDVTQVIRSKNAGPFELTFDIIFKKAKDATHFKDKKIITPGLISSLYKIPKKNILDIIYFEQANAIKITIKRPIPSGAIGEKDIYGAQQHVPLLQIYFE